MAQLLCKGLLGNTGVVVCHSAVTIRGLCIDGGSQYSSSGGVLHHVPRGVLLGEVGEPLVRVLHGTLVHVLVCRLARYKLGLGVGGRRGLVLRGRQVLGQHGTLVLVLGPLVLVLGILVLVLDRQVAYVLLVVQLLVCKN